MGNNKEIRQRMETYRNVLLAIVWVSGIALMIAGLIMIGYAKSGGGYYSSATISHPLRPYGIAILIVSALGSIIGHFLVNVGLAVPFILLNNGDLLESLKSKSESTGFVGTSNVSPIIPVVNSEDSWVCKKCGERNPNTAPICKSCGEYK